MVMMSMKTYNVFFSASESGAPGTLKQVCLSSVSSFERHQNSAVLPPSMRDGCGESPNGCCSSYPGKSPRHKILTSLKEKISSGLICV